MQENEKIMKTNKQTEEKQQQPADPKLSSNFCGGGGWGWEPGRGGCLPRETFFFAQAVSRLAGLAPLQSYESVYHVETFGHVESKNQD